MQKYIQNDTGINEIDWDLKKQAVENLEEKAQSTNYLNKRLVTRDGGVAIPRWASDLDLVQNICKTQ